MAPRRSAVAPAASTDKARRRNPLSPCGTGEVRRGAGRLSSYLRVQATGPSPYLSPLKRGRRSLTLRPDPSTQAAGRLRLRSEAHNGPVGNRPRRRLASMIAAPFHRRSETRRHIGREESKLKHDPSKGGVTNDRPPRHNRRLVSRCPRLRHPRESGVVLGRRMRMDRPERSGGPVIAPRQRRVRSHLLRRRYDGLTAVGRRGAAAVDHVATASTNKAPVKAPSPVEPARTAARPPIPVLALQP